ncbi:DNA-binding response regulator, LuxR family [uncultured Candidatus Thioglobus sp.]|nr:DNA-binding response regulator, LuxR family [uncultured Candidatus Thioglobus sp.]
MKKSILIVDDQLLIRQALVAMLSKHDEFKVVGEASSGEQAIEIAKTQQPALVLLDIHMPIMDGETTAKEICKILPNSYILALSGVKDKSRIGQLFHSGIDGFLSKDSINAEKLIVAINTILAGDIYLDEHIFASNIKDGVNINSIIADSIGNQLTKREKEILILLTQGLNNIQIGAKLFISDKTVAKHRENIMRKSHSNNIAQLINYAKDAGFIN